MTRPSVQIDVSFEDQTAERVFGALEPDLSTSLWPQRAKRTDNPSHYVHVVAASGCRLELGQELSKDKIEEILVTKGQKEMFVLALHLGMRAPPIQFTSPYGDRIKIGQVVYTDRKAPLLELVPEAEGAPLSVCKSKFAAFLQSGCNNDREVGSRSNRNNTNKNKSDEDLEACKGDEPISKCRISRRQLGCTFFLLSSLLSTWLAFGPGLCPLTSFVSSASFGLSASPECSPSPASLGVKSSFSLPPAPVPPMAVFPAPFAVPPLKPGSWIRHSNASSQPLPPFALNREPRERTPNRRRISGA